MASTESPAAKDPVEDAGAGAETPADEVDDPGRFGGERTTSTASARVGWDENAEDIDALLTDEEKSGAATRGEQSPEDT